MTQNNIGIQTKNGPNEYEDLDKDVFQRGLTNASFIGKKNSECSRHIYLGHELYTVNDSVEKLSKREQTAWEGFKSVGKR